MLSLKIVWLCIAASGKMRKRLFYTRNATKYIYSSIALGYWGTLNGNNAPLARAALQVKLKYYHWVGRSAAQQLHKSLFPITLLLLKYNCECGIFTCNGVLYVAPLLLLLENRILKPPTDSDTAKDLNIEAFLDPAGKPPYHRGILITQQRS